MAILGVWIGISIAMFFVATQNFRGVDRLLETPAPEASRWIGQLGHDTARVLLRYQVSELNRYFFDTYCTVQIVLALMLGFVLLFATNGHKLTIAISAVLLLLTLFQKFWLVPEVTYLGRAIDFVPPSTFAAERARFWSFHHAFSGMEGAKFLIFIVLAARMLPVNDRRRRSARREEDEEDEPRPAEAARG